MEAVQLVVEDPVGAVVVVPVVHPNFQMVVVDDFVVLVLVEEVACSAYQMMMVVALSAYQNPVYHQQEVAVVLVYSN